MSAEPESSETPLHADDLRVELGDDLSSAAATAEPSRRFDEHGAFIARGLLPSGILDEIRGEIRQLITLARSRAGMETERGAAFDAGFEELCERDPDASDAIFHACRRLASVHRLSVEPRLLALSRSLMRTELVMVPPYKPVRIDWQSRDYALLPWHQDYPYAQDSPDGVVYWIPLVDVDEDNGCLEVAAGSHKGGVQPVEMLLPPPDSEDRVKGIALADPDVACRWPHLRLPMAADEVLALSVLTLHSSRPNYTDKPRWTVQIRHGNFADPTAVDKRWPRGHYEGHWFDESHPENVREPGAEP